MSRESSVWLVRVLGLTFALPFALWPVPAHAMVGFSRLTYVCPSPYQITFSWSPATNATSYALQLQGPLDLAINGGVAGTYVRQFGVIEVANGQINSASVTLSPPPIPLVEAWQLMLGDAKGYTGMVPRQQVALVPVPCTQTAPVQSPYF